MSENKLLNVYKASAGSGKTYRLVINYIKLLINYPKNYRHILAVTFTNKATAEMKSRILDNLDLISKTDIDPTDKRYNYRKGLIDNLLLECPEQKQSEIEIACRMARDYILNDYSQFNISTIDKFEQKIIRAFACEAQLSSSYSVEIDIENYLRQAIDEVKNLASTDGEVRGWILDYINELMSGKGSWSFDNKLFELSKRIIFNSDNSDFFDNLSIYKLRDFKEKIYKIKESIQKKIFELIDEYANIIKTNYLTDPGIFIRGKTSYTYKLATSKDIKEKFFEYFVKKNIIDKHFSTNGKIFNTDHPLEGQLIQILRELGDFVNQNIKDYCTATLLLNDIHSFGLLVKVREKLYEISNNERIMYISETPKLLQGLIDNSPLPFIYEKIGSQINHMMIDEFQDTSIVQWNNFEPLLRNCIDTYAESDNEVPHESLIVGDVKQAIYRWRGSKWELLDTITDENKSSYSNVMNVRSLSENRRSLRNIVEFNNTIFAEDAILCSLGNLLSDYTGQDEVSELNRLYSTAQQLPATHSNQEGFVKAKFTSIEGKNDKEDLTENEDENDSDYLSKVLQDVVEQINILKAKGFQYNEMTILVRNGNEANDIVTVLVQNEIPVVTSDTLLVCNSPAVELIINFYRYLYNSKDEQALINIALICYPEFKLFDEERKNQIKEISHDILSLKGLGIIELTQTIIKRIPKSLRDEEYVYIEAFLDFVNKLVTTRYITLKELLDYIEQKKDSLNLAAPDNQDAITLMTIHKSKGLENKVILIPFADWKIKTDGYIWATLPEPFSFAGKERKVPIKCDRYIKYSYAQNAYFEERRLDAIDNLNLLYVAFTRARDVLMIWGRCNFGKNDKSKEPPKYTQNTRIALFLYQTLCKKYRKFISPDFNESLENKDDVVVFQYGTIPTPTHERRDESYLIKSYDFATTNIYARSRRDIDEDRASVIEYGNKMHALMEQIKTISDIDRAVEMAILRGDFAEIAAQKLCSELRQRLTCGPLAPLFDGSAKRIYTEDTILESDNELRPDRISIFDDKVVVLDYKFGSKNKKYITQVQRYMKLMQEAGYNQVEGIIWYYNDNEIVEVK